MCGRVRLIVFALNTMADSKQKVLEHRVNIDEPRYDQSTYWGRARHFFTVTNSLNLFVGNKELDKAKDIVTRYR